jgi:large subunit ribosomal protein L19
VFHLWLKNIDRNVTRLRLPPFGRRGDLRRGRRAGAQIEFQFAFLHRAWTMFALSKSGVLPRSIQGWDTRYFSCGWKAASTLMNRIIDAIEKEQQKTDVTKFGVGDSVHVHTRVVEGDKERIQIFTGIVIGRKGRGLNETFTVRRISYGEGVERVFPVHSPRIAKVEVEKEGRGRARRAKLNYLRGRKGKEATAVRE